MTASWPRCPQDMFALISCLEEVLACSLLILVCCTARLVWSGSSYYKAVAQLPTICFFYFLYPPRGASNTQGTAECAHLWLLGVRGRSSCCFSHVRTGKPFPPCIRSAIKAWRPAHCSSPRRGARSHTSSRAGRCRSGLP